MLYNNIYTVIVESGIYKTTTLHSRQSSLISAKPVFDVARVACILKTNEKR